MLVERDDRIEKIRTPAWRDSCEWKDFRTHEPGDSYSTPVASYYAVIVELKKADFPNMLHLGDGDTFLEYGGIAYWNTLSKRFQVKRDYLDNVRYWTELPAWPRETGEPRC